MEEQVHIHDKEVLPNQGGFRRVSNQGGFRRVSNQGGFRRVSIQGEFRRGWMTADPIEYGLLKENAKTNRKNMTEAESVFWSLVKRGALGQRCLRQHIIGDYIVDFLFRKSKVIVEIDGGYHFTEEQEKEDTIRTEWLERQGYKVVRFTNDQILMETNKITEILKSSLNREDLGGSFI